MSGNLKVAANYLGASLICITALAFASSVVEAQSDLKPPDSATVEVQKNVRGDVHGFVRDAAKKSIAGAVVLLDGGAQTLTTHTDTNGAFRFASLAEGRYKLRVSTDGSAEDETVVDLTIGESKEIDLVLGPAKTTVAGSSTVPEFFDEPHFTVAGVTDTTTLGGHGSSEAIIRNKESIVKEAASLNAGPNAASRAGTHDPENEKSLRDAVDRAPSSFAPNYELGKLLDDEGKASEAIPYLQKASKLNAGDIQNRYELALAYFRNAQYQPADAELVTLLGLPENRDEEAVSRHLRGEVCEKLGGPLEAVREFQRAAELSPSEENLFDWGSQLLRHRAAEPAAEVFAKGNRLFPNSVRMLTALGAAWYELGFYDKAAQSLCAASDLDPSDTEPYLVMGKMQSVDAIPTEAVAQRLERFAKLHPESALANYYYAVSLEKSSNSAETQERVKGLLLKSAQLDPKLAEAYLQLGVVYAEEKDFVKAISFYRQAIAADFSLEQAHYRLAQAYRQTDEPAKAQDELQAYEKISKQKAEETESKRREVRQFVYQQQPEPPPPR
jgi:tetratricopeptide (TPR) repeat protein